MAGAKLRAWWTILMFSAAMALLLATVFWWSIRTPRSGTLQGSMSVRQVLGEGDRSGYAQAAQPGVLRFPDDHGPHPEFRNEWWYFTGNVETEAKRHFGYQLTLFRSALAPPPTLASSAAVGDLLGRAADLMPANSSRWRTRQGFMAHFAVTDVQSGRLHAHERFSRGALGLAGARALPFRVWLEDWSVATSGDEPFRATANAGENEMALAIGSDQAIFPLRLRATVDDLELDLDLEPQKPIVLQGEQGLSRKGVGTGNASYYYSFTRLGTTGTLHLGGRSYQVAGSSWLDREWSTGALRPELVGWDWFALQLADGRELMLYRLRRRDGSIDPASSGVVVDVEGGTRSLAADDVQLRVLSTWTSPRGDAVYPIRWRLRVDPGLEIEIEPYIRAQELDLAFRYWEGAVRVRGVNGDEGLAGHGYVELTGYADSG